MCVPVVCPHFSHFILLCLSQVSQGLIWVWADASAESWLTAPGSTPSVLPAELASGEYDVKGPWFQRDAPLSLDTLVENFIDPSHVPFSHHGVVVSGEGRRCTACRVEPFGCLSIVTLVVNTHRPAN